MKPFIDELEVRGTWRYGPSSHLLPFDQSPEAIEALHELAQRAGLKRSWFQDKNRWPHYDCAARLRTKCVKAGATEIKTKGYLHLERYRKAGKFKEPGSGLLMHLGLWYVLSDSGSSYSGMGYATWELARARALGMKEYELSERDIAVCPWPPDNLRDPMPESTIANVVKADALLLFWCIEDYWELVTANKEK